MEGLISFWGYKEKESNLILPEHDDDDDDNLTQLISQAHVLNPGNLRVLIYIKQDATLHSLFISENCSTCFEWYLHPSSGAQTTVSTASGICHTVIAICRYRGRFGTGLSVLSHIRTSSNSTAPSGPRPPS